MTPHMDAVLTGLLVFGLFIWGCWALGEWLDRETETETWRGE